MTISEQKAAARKQAYGVRKTAFGLGLDVAANHNLLGQLALYRDTSVIAAYMPIRTEISPVATMTILYGQEKRICVPVIQGAGLSLKFREWKPDTTLIEGPFGAMVPDAGEDLLPDVLITPLLAFDRQGYRLGYGGGFYDRSFAQLTTMKKIVALGFAYGVQEIPLVPTEPTDFRLDAIVTENGVLSL
jgi:5-formyltetrahydrofolate cyclo-ligase